MVDHVAPKKLTVVLEDYQVQAIKKISTQKKVSQSKLFQEAVDLLLAHHHFSRVEPDYTRDIDEFIAKNRDLLKSLFR